MRIERVARQRSFQMELEPSSSRGLGHPRIHLDNLVGRPAVFPHQHLATARRPVARCGGIQLKRAMDDVHLVTIVEARERFLEAALADVAPRTDEVGPDIDAHVAQGSGLRDKTLWSEP